MMHAKIPAKIQAKMPQPRPGLDLVFERVVDVPRELVWRAWTKPEQLMKWFTPVPWKTIACEIDLRPGGRFHTVMQSPDGRELPNVGCYLDVVENERLVWTNALEEGFRPTGAAMTCGGDAFFAFTAIISLASHGAGTRYTALVMHGDEASTKRHEEMGFHDGWGKALEQLVAVAKTM
jgi:uncharacterized protein YndB with AHSA1/START domain